MASSKKKTTENEVISTAVEEEVVEKAPAKTKSTTAKKTTTKAETTKTETTKKATAKSESTKKTTTKTATTKKSTTKAETAKRTTSKVAAEEENVKEGTKKATAKKTTPTSKSTTAKKTTTTTKKTSTKKDAEKSKSDWVEAELHATSEVIKPDEVVIMLDLEEKIMEPISDIKVVEEDRPVRPQGKKAKRQKDVKKQRRKPILDMFKDAVILTIITLLAGFMLGFVYEITKPAIAAQEAKAIQEACAKVFDEASTFEQIEYTPNVVLSDELTAMGVSIGKVYKAKNVNGEDLGFVIESTTNEGYAGNITIFMGITLQNQLNGISILTIGETPGLGMRAEEVLVPQFANKPLTIFTYSKNGSVMASEIDAISGATITTKAIVNAVNGGVRVVTEDLMKGGM